MESGIAFDSCAIELKGILHVPDGLRGRAPALLVCHGFGGNSSGADRRAFARAFEEAGYVVLRFDFRGCGASGGEPGRVICEEEVEDVRNAVTHIAGLDMVDPARIGIIGGSLGGSVAIQATALDERLACCIANGAIGNGERRFRHQYPDEAEWRAFRTRVEEAVGQQERTGQPVLMNRFDIVAIPEQARAGLSPGARMAFPAETALSMLRFTPEDVVHRIAPRPLLLTHPAGDQVVPCSESEHLAARARPPVELRILEGGDHFSSGSRALHDIILEWLGRHLPPAHIKEQACNS